VRVDPAVDLYLELLRGCLTRTLFQEEEVRDVGIGGWRARVWDGFRRYSRHPELRLVKPTLATAEARRARVDGNGHYSQNFETSISHDRLKNIQHCITSVLEDEIPGDLVEAGVQRGGAAIFTRAVLAAHGVGDRRVWLADTFTGMPVPNPDSYPADAGYDQLTGHDPNAIGVERVKANFTRYGLLDDSVQFLVGLFKDTLPTAPLGPLAVVRLDSDLYESTIDSITVLYPKLSIGGYLIIDDYNSSMWSKACGQAIRDYRTEHDVTEPMQQADWNAVYWRRER
jgi:O-methyltransferase